MFGGIVARGRLPTKAATMRGHIDNGPVIWILLIVGAIAYLQYHKLRTGENLLAFVSPTVWWYLGAVAVVVFGGIAAIVAGKGAKRREMRSFAAEGSTIVVVRGTPQRFGGALLVALGVASLVFGLLGRGWGWGTVAACGVFLCAVGLRIAGQGRRWVLAKDQIRTESLWYGRPSPGENWALDAAQPRRLALVTSRAGGAFGQPSTEHYRVLLDDRPLYAGTDRGQAEAFLEAARQAYPDARRNEESG